MTIEQIHEDAQKEVLGVELSNMTPDPPNRRSEDRSDRSQPCGKDSRNDRGWQDMDWNNVSSKAAKIQEKVDPSKLKVSKVCNLIKKCQLITTNLFQVDINSLSFGPPGGFGDWSKGSPSASSANKKMLMEV